MKILERIEYYKIIKDILKSDEFQKRRNFPHHGKITVYDHSLAVSKLSYKIAKILKVDYRSAAIGGLLHDFYEKPWQTNKKKKILEKHGFTHAREAMLNSRKYFPELMNEKIENIILRHMIPLNKIPPKYIEGWIVTLADKYVSLETVKNPRFFLDLFGIGRKGE